MPWSLIRQDAFKDSVQLEERRVALLAKYKIREAVAFLAQQDSLKLEEVKLASAY